MEGSLTGFTLQEIFELLAAKKKSGILTIESPACGRGSVGLKQGRLCLADMPGIQAGERGADPDWVKDNIEDALQDILEWPESVYDFQAGEEVVKDSTGPTLDVGGVLADIAKRQAEWDKLRTEIPSLQARVELIAGVETESVSLTKDEWSLVALIGKHTTAQELQKQLNVSPLVICRSLFSMSKKGLIRCLGEVVEAEADPEEKERPAEAKAIGKKYIRKSLLADEEAENMVPAEWASYYELLDSRDVMARSKSLWRAVEH